MSPRNATEIGQRRWYDVPGGKRVPSATTVLKGFPNEIMQFFYSKAVAERAVWQYKEFVERFNSDDAVKTGTLKWLKAAPLEKRDKAAASGTNLHTYLAGRLDGTISPDDADEVGLSDSEVAIEQFLSVYRPDPLLIESQVYSAADGWAGSADLFASIYGVRGCLDLKTETYGLTNWKNVLQVDAYRHADLVFEDGRDLGPVPSTDCGWILWVPRDKPQNWSLIRIEDNGREHYSVFLACKRLWDFYTRTKDTSIGELVLPQTKEAA